MALQFSIAVRNAMLDAIETTIGTAAKLQIRTGSAPATCATASSGTLLVEFSLISDWATAASSGAKAFAAVTTTAAAAAGTAAHFRLLDSTGTTCHWQGTVTATGGGGDLTLNNTVIALAQDVVITSWTITAPGV
jgi:hypothetical protein